MRFSKYLAVLSCMLVVVGFAILYHFVARDREQEISRSYQELTRVTSIIEQHVFLATTDIENLLKHIRKEVEAKRNLTEMRLLLINLADLYADRVNLLVVTDSEGNLFTSSQIPFQELNIGDRSFFTFHNNSGFQGMLISHPLLGRATDKTFIPMSLRLQNEGSNFSGIALSSTKPEYFQTFFSSISSDPDLIMLLALETGDVLATSGINDASSMHLFNNRVFLEIASGREIAKGFHKFVDEKPRMVVAGKIDRYPLYFLIAKEESAVLSNHRSRLRFAVALASGLLAVLLLFNWTAFLIAKKASQKARELEKAATESQLFFKAFPEGVWEWKMGEQKITLNAAFSELLGYERTERASDLQTWVARIHPEDFPLVEKALQRHQELKQKFSMDYRIKLKNGDWRWFSVKGIVVESDDTGAPLRMIGSAVDAQRLKDLCGLAETEKQALMNAESRVEELIRSSEKKELFLETFLQGLQTIHESLSFSTAASKLLTICQELTDSKDGYIALLNDDLKTQRIYAIGGGINPSSILHFPVKVCETERSVYKEKGVCYEEGVEIEWLREPGNLPIYLENAAFAPVYAYGEVIGLLCLANRVGGFKMLGQTFFDTFSLLFSIAYEINLKREGHSAFQCRRKEVERIRASQSDESEKGFFSLTELIQEAINELPKEKPESLRIRYDVHHEVPLELRGDSASIKLTLTRLLKDVTDNRAKGEISVSAYKSKQGNTDGQNTCWIDVAIQDIGTKSPTENLEATAITSPTVTGGTGMENRVLTEAVQKARKAVESMGGKLELEAEKGDGTVITLKLPLFLKENAPREATLPDAVPESEFEGLTILVAEDDPINRRIIKALLERRGCIVLESQDGAQAVELWRTRKVDLILMDIRMPKADGYEATKIIREEETARAAGTRTPILALTAYAMQEDKNKCIALGMNEHISKPIQKEELLTKILLLTDRAGIRERPR